MRYARKTRDNGLCRLLDNVPGYGQLAGVRDSRALSRAPAVNSRGLAADLAHHAAMPEDRYPWLEDQVVRTQLAEVETLPSKSACVGGAPAELHDQLLSTRSKRIRPAILLLCARFGARAPSNQLVEAAAALEQVHEATLYHDDIVDRSDMRRGTPSVQRALGPAAAAFVGSDLLYASAYLCARMPARIHREIAITAQTLCRGQMREVERVGDEFLGIPVRIRTMAAKTASLFRLAARMGEMLAGVPRPAMRALDRFAMRFGLCFQLADDLRDIVGTCKSLGRAPRRDLWDGVYTLPVLFALQRDAQVGGRLSEVLQALRAHPEEAMLYQAAVLVRELGGLERSREVLAAWVARARVELEALTQNQAQPVKRSLHGLLTVVASAFGGDAGPGASAKPFEDYMGRC